MLRLALLRCAFFAAVLLQFSPAVASDEPGARDPCTGSTTPEMNTCYGNKLRVAEAELDRYFRAAIVRNLEAGEEAAVLGFRNSQAAFEAYRTIACGAVHERWKSGTIRTVMELTCSIALTDQRTHAIWASWLTYPDGTPPTLPEPMPTE